MNQDVYHLLQTLQAHMNHQQHTILHLQKKINSLEKKISEFEKRPPVHVGRLEYKFDQLKVETLEGTLNIGLNPADLQGIEDFSVPTQKGVLTPQDRSAMVTDIDQSIQDYLENHLNSIIQETTQSLQIQNEESYREFILQDIKKQLPTRIEYYLNQPYRKENPDSVEQKDWIVEQLKKEIHHGVTMFLKNLPQNMKGPKTE